ncbi:MAG: hypothetical protein B6229_00440 [Spirochaetaceae bacterium 4572_7]|nr:MAG: hypothetical protein B6229_00440 [Spirochaetaceae bacterium 4572_7]
MNSKEKKKFRQTKKWKEFRKVMLEKVDYKCQMCSIKKKKGLHIHHINEEAYGKETSSDVVVLCSLCHREIERLLKRKEFDINIYILQLKNYYNESKK